MQVQTNTFFDKTKGSIAALNETLEVTEAADKLAKLVASAIEAFQYFVTDRFLPLSLLKAQIKNLTEVYGALNIFSRMKEIFYDGYYTSKNSIDKRISRAFLTVANIAETAKFLDASKAINLAACSISAAIVGIVKDLFVCLSSLFSIKDNLSKIYSQFPERKEMQRFGTHIVKWAAKRDFLDALSNNSDEELFYNKSAKEHVEAVYKQSREEIEGAKDRCKIVKYDLKGDALHCEKGEYQPKTRDEIEKKWTTWKSKAEGNQKWEREHVIAKLEAWQRVKGQFAFEEKKTQAAVANDIFKLTMISLSYVINLKLVCIGLRGLQVTLGGIGSSVGFYKVRLELQKPESVRYEAPSLSK